MKKAFSTIFFMILLLSFSNITHANSLKDVQNYNGEIDYLLEREIMETPEDGYFYPTSPITRLEAVVALVKAIGVNLGDEPLPELQFSDFDEANFGHESVAYAVKMGIISGKPDGSFDPEGTLTRSQSAKILSLAFGLEGTTYKTFSDVKAGTEIEKYVGAMASNNITTGYLDGTFGINKKLSKQHFAVFLARTLNEDFRLVPKEDLREIVYTPNQYSVKVEDVYEKYNVDLFANDPNDFIVSSGQIRHVFSSENGKNSYTVFYAEDNTTTFKIASEAVVKLGIGISSKEFLTNIEKARKQLGGITIDGIYYEANGRLIMISW